jgi:hypothetical protein
MHDPKHPADMFLVPRGFLELQQRGFELGKQILRLFLERFTELGDYLFSRLFVYRFLSWVMTPCVLGGPEQVLSWSGCIRSDADSRLMRLFRISCNAPKTKRLFNLVADRGGTEQLEQGRSA